MLAWRLGVAVVLLGVVTGVGGKAVRARPAAICAPRVTLLARGYGSPDDVAVSGGRILFGDLSNGVLAEERNGRISILASGLSTPEGIVVEAHNRALVVEQGRNRIDQIDLATGRRRVVLSMLNTTGQEGIDGIHPAPNGGLYVPDSPYGTLYLFDAHHRLHLLAGGMARPVDAIRYRRAIAVADENDHAVWLIRNGRRQRLATLDVPDDLVIFHGRLLADSLGDGRVWEVAPRLRLLAGGFNQPQGLAVLNSHTLVVTGSNTNGIYDVTNVAQCL